jgi:hypothetical protein
MLESEAIAPIFLHLVNCWMSVISFMLRTFSPRGEMSGVRWTGGCVGDTVGLDAEAKGNIAASTAVEARPSSL